MRSGRAATTTGAADAPGGNPDFGEFAILAKRRYGAML